MASVSQFGYELRFCGPVVRALPDALVQDLVAHELAHVVQAASEQWFLDDADTIEFEADELVLDWGFEVDALDEWLAGVSVSDLIEDDFLVRTA